ncbi:hypothetical protein [Archangium violaceum]|uniref:hypothetical protein n=1 Tax=Archangium violaceum TaxID=83451 RepID=UPI0036DDD86A
MVENKIVNAPYPRALGPLHQRLNGYLGSYDRIYIGATANPWARWPEHVPYGWEKMVVLYEAYNPAIARDLEQDLIQYARESNFMTEVMNISPGGEGIRDDSGRNYVYVLVG